MCLWEDWHYTKVHANVCKIEHYVKARHTGLQAVAFGLSFGAIVMSFFYPPPPPPRIPPPCTVPQGTPSLAHLPPKVASLEKPPPVTSKHVEAQCGAWCIVPRGGGTPSLGNSPPGVGNTVTHCWGAVPGGRRGGGYLQGLP